MLENLEPPKAIRPCKIRTIMERMDQTDVDILNAALADENKWKDWVLFRALEERGVEVSPNVLTKHRRNLCSCRFINA